MKCKMCEVEVSVLFEHCGAWYCNACIETVTIPMEVFSRIVGYYRPIQNWNAGKQKEFADRVVYRAPHYEGLLPDIAPHVRKQLYNGNFENTLPEPAEKPRALLVAPFEAKL